MRRRIRDFILSRTGRILDLGDLASAPEIQAKVALLLAGVADSDGAITDDEFLRIVELMRGLFDLNENVSLDLLVKAMHELRERDDLHQITTELGARLDLESKEELILMMLQVIAADGQKHPSEMAYLRRFAEALDLPEGRAARAFDRYALARRPLPAT